MKICRLCKEEKEMSEYHKHPATLDKRFSICKECANEISRNRYKTLKLDPVKYIEERARSSAQKRNRRAELKRKYGKK